MASLEATQHELVFVQASSKRGGGGVAMGLECSGDVGVDGGGGGVV